MKYLASLLLGVLLLSGCGGGSGLKPTIDPKAFENREELQKIYDAILSRMGDQASKVDEVAISIDNPADDGETGDAYLHVMADVQDPDNLKQLLRHQFLGEAGYWMDPQSVTVTVQGSDEEKTNFRLEDSLFDFTGDVSIDMLNKVVQQAYAQDNAEPDRFTYRYVEQIRITIEGYDISVTGKLAANDQVINDYYDFDFKGNLLD